jgi:hypothetical protein
VVTTYLVVGLRRVLVRVVSLFSVFLS